MIIGDYYFPLRCRKCGSYVVNVLEKTARSYKCQCTDCQHAYYSNGQAAAAAWERLEAKRNSVNGW